MPTLTKLLGSLTLALGLVSGSAGAQNATPVRPVPPAAPAAISLQLAYRAIGDAESRGAPGRYLDGARTHYRAALARFGRDDAQGAAGEAMAAAALARAAVNERPLPVPRDIPTPPPVTAAPARPPGFGGPGGPRAFGGRSLGVFDPEALRRYAMLQNTPEANDLARNALEANIAHERALFAGNRDEGMRQRRLARDLAAAVRFLASADHPEAFPRPMRRPLGPPGSFGPRPPQRADLDVDSSPDDLAAPVVVGAVIPDEFFEDDSY